MKRLVNSLRADLWPRSQAVRAGLALVCLTAPWWAPSEYVLHILIMIGIYSILAMSLNLISGYTGQLSIGHAAFFAIGAYTFALLTVRAQFSFWPAFVGALICSGIAGLLLGLPTLRVHGAYLAMCTLGFAETVRVVLDNWIGLTRGPMGLTGIPGLTLFGYEFFSKTPYYFLIVTMVCVCWLVMRRLEVSTFGLSMLTVREDEIVGETIGINTIAVKLTAFVIGAMFAGVAGAFYASYIHFVSPNSFNFLESAMILAMIVLGGLANTVGAALGAAILVTFPEALRFLQEYRMVIYGLMLVLIMIFRPQGLWGINRRRRNGLVDTAIGLAHRPDEEVESS